MHHRLIQLDVYKNSYEKILDKFYKKQNAKNLKIHITDNINVLNKYGIDKIGYNKMVPRTKYQNYLLFVMAVEYH